MTVDTTRHARASSSVANRPATIGISADDSAPAATSWKIRSGMPERGEERVEVADASGSVPTIAT